MAFTRRAFLATAAATSALAGLPSRAVFANAAGDRRFVLIVLRGGLDGLSTVVPYGDPAYARARGDLALKEPGRNGGALELDGFYGLHPALKHSKTLFDRGELLAVHATASPYRERSHFDAQDLLENGSAMPRGRNDGWLNRSLAALGGDSRSTGISIGQGLPLVLRGAAAVATWEPTALPQADARLLDLVSDLYRDDPLLSRALAEGIETTEMAEAVLGGAMQGKGRRIAGPQTGLAETAGRFLADPDGPRIAVLEAGGWDTHAYQGAAEGRLARSLAGLDASIAALQEALGPAWETTAVLAVTEFGRTVAANGTGGTDHGTAGCALLYGSAVAGGRVAAEWPGLDRLYENRDLAPTTDLRAIFKAVLAGQFGLPRRELDGFIFPASEGIAPLEGLLRA